MSAWLFFSSSDAHLDLIIAAMRSAQKGLASLLDSCPPFLLVSIWFPWGWPCGLEALMQVPGFLFLCPMCHFFSVWYRQRSELSNSSKWPTRLFNKEEVVWFFSGILHLSPVVSTAEHPEQCWALSGMVGEDMLETDRANCSNPSSSVRRSPVFLRFL